MPQFNEKNGDYFGFPKSCAKMFVFAEIFALVMNNFANVFAKKDISSINMSVK